MSWVWEIAPIPDGFYWAVRDLRTHRLAVGASGSREAAKQAVAHKLREFSFDVYKHHYLGMS